MLHEGLSSLEAAGHRSRCVHPAAKLAELGSPRDGSRRPSSCSRATRSCPRPRTASPCLQLLRGEPALAAATIHRRLNRIGDDNVLSAPFLSMLIDVRLVQGDLDGAVETAERLDAVARRSGLPRIEAAAAHAMGRVGIASGRTDAPDLLEDAIARYAAAGMTVDAARSRFDLARALEEAQPDVAVGEARTALAEFERLGAPRDADAAAELLRRHGVRGRTGPKDVGLLSRREQEVLALVAEGLKNAEVAARLHLSTKTVGHHVSNVLAKLGVKSRGEAAAWALRHLRASTPEDPDGDRERSRSFLPAVSAPCAQEVMRMQRTGDRVRNGNALKKELVVRVEADSKASADTVYAVIADLRTHTIWAGERREEDAAADDTPADPAVVGTEFHTTGSDPMGTFDDGSVVTEASPGRAFEFVTEARLTTKKGTTSGWTCIGRYELTPTSEGVPDCVHGPLHSDERAPGDARAVQRPGPPRAHDEAGGEGQPSYRSEPRAVCGGAGVGCPLGDAKDRRRNVRREWSDCTDRREGGAMGKVAKSTAAEHVEGPGVRGALRRDRGLHDRVRALQRACGHDAAVRRASGRQVPVLALGRRPEGQARVPHARGDVEIADGEAYYVGPGHAGDATPTRRSSSSARPTSSSGRWRSSRRTWRHRASHALERRRTGRMRRIRPVLVPGGCNAGAIRGTGSASGERHTEGGTGWSR